MTFQFEKLQVYQKALDFADEVCSATELFSRGYGFPLDKLNRAALSISANIAEGNGRFTKADRKNFFIIARGSVQELGSRRRVHSMLGGFDPIEALKRSSIRERWQRQSTPPKVNRWRQDTRFFHAASIDFFLSHANWPLSGSLHLQSA